MHHVHPRMRLLSTQDLDLEIWGKGRSEGNRTAFHMIFDCQLSRGRARAPGCQRCFEAVLIRTAIRLSGTAAALPSHASSIHQDTPSEEVAALVRAHGTGRTCLYRSAVDARLAGRLHARKVPR